MPTYEYECTRGCRFEIEQSIKDDALKRCPKSACPRGTGGVSVRRLISAPSFILKGGGWYADGYSSKGAPKSKQGNGAGESGKDSSPPASKPGDSGSSASKDSGSGCGGACSRGASAD